MKKRENVLLKKEMLEFLGKTEQEIKKEITEVLTSTDEEFVKMSKKHRAVIERMLKRVKTSWEILNEVRSKKKSTEAKRH